MSVFSERLKAVRRHQKKKQTDVADIIGCTPNHYQKIEYGKVNIPMSELIALADYFDVSIDYLTGRCDNPLSHK